jgi:hypothetical protein
VGIESANNPLSLKEHTMPTQTKAGPVHEVRLGAIKASIWSNETSVGTRHNVTVARLYKDDDEWKQSESFGRDDLLVLAKIVDLWLTAGFSPQRSDPPSPRLRGNICSP